MFLSVYFRNLFLPVCLRSFLFLCLFLYVDFSLACEDEQCVPANSFQLGVGLGAGIKTNPLIGGDNIPLILLPDISWYGEKAYFDNGELGFQWLSKEHLALDTFIRLDDERTFFSFIHPNNIFLSSVLSPPALTPSSPGSENEADNIKYPQRASLSVEQIAKRKWAVNAGFRIHYFVGNAEFTSSLQQDISQLHQGKIVSLTYKYKWLIQDIRLKFTAGVHWKSSKLLDYYYGITLKDTDYSEFHYQASSGFEPFFSVTLQKPINQNWLWLGNIGTRRLSSAMTNSPIVEEKHVNRIFLGVAYRF